MKIAWGRVLVSGILFTIISMIVRQIESILTMKYYLMPQYFGVWSKLMMPNAGPPPMSFFLISLLFSFITGIGLAIFFQFIKEGLSRAFWPRVFGFFGISFGLGFLFFSLTTYLMINLPLALQASWLVSSAIVLFLSGIVYAKIIK
ncbi:MAG TPA: hypothetical protein VFQ60_05295 [Patescibacteria group bacterium]|nr:hypothetical protein [Patescibacteria group bacterium]